MPKGDYDDFYAVTSVADEADVSVAQGKISDKRQDYSKDLNATIDSLNPVPRMPLGHLRDDIAAASVYEMIAEKGKIVWVKSPLPTPPKKINKKLKKGFVDDTIFLPLSAPFNEKEKISSVSNAIYLAKRYGARSIVELGDGLVGLEQSEYVWDL